jgi:Mg2+/Co2+ transporter CorB
MIAFYILIIVLLGACASVLSASETAVTASSRLRLHQLAKKGNKKAALLLKLQESMASLISTILLVSMCLLSAMTSLATELSTSYFGKIGVVLIPLVMGGITTIYVEVLPKIYVYRHPEKVGTALAPFLQFLKKILSPITAVVDKIAHSSLSLFGPQSASTQLSSTVEELRGAIDLHIGEGFVPHERAMLRSILDLSRVMVSEIMVHRKKIISVNIETPFAELCQKIFSAPVTRMPLWKGTPDNIVGIINTKSLAQELYKNPQLSDLTHLAKAPWFIPETTVLFAQLQRFKEKHSHLAFVVDEYGALLGMVTLEDILEEIVGEILDEHDVALPGVRLTPDGDYLVHGWVTLRDLHREYDWIFPETQTSTIAGLILNETRTIPETGEILTLSGFEIKILRRNRNQITLVRMRPLGQSY